MKSTYENETTEQRLSRTIHISGLSAKTTDRPLKAFLSSIAPPVKIRIVPSRNFAFILMHSSQEAHAVIGHLDEQLLDGMPVRVAPAILDVFTPSHHIREIVHHRRGGAVEKRLRGTTLKKHLSDYVEEGEAAADFERLRLRSPAAALGFAADRLWGRQVEPGGGGLLAVKIVIEESPGKGETKIVDPGANGEAIDIQI